MQGAKIEIMQVFSRKGLIKKPIHVKGPTHHAQIMWERLVLGMNW